jgi:transcriptional regulator NrdR family protein
MSLRLTSNTCPECNEQHCPVIGEPTMHEELDVVLLRHACPNCGTTFETVFEPMTQEAIDE